MRRIVEQARSIGDAVVGAVRRAVDPPLTADARPLDIKRAIVELVEQQVEPAGGGRRVLPGDFVQVRVLAEQDQTKPLDAVLSDIREVIRTRLLELQCEVPRRFAVEVSYVGRPLEEWEPDQRLEVVVRADRHAPAARRAVVDPDEATQPVLIVEVVRGQATKQQFTFCDAVIRIGRSPDPTDERGRPRTNDVAFLENESAENLTVTRGHALIRFDPRTGEYRLFDEGSANGTRVLRSGEAIDVPRRDPVGVSLRPGDEVQFGKAAVRIRIEAGSEAPGGPDNGRPHER